jgi:uncharacterized protein
MCVRRNEPPMTCIKLRTLAFAVATAWAAAILPARAQNGPQPRLPTVDLSAGIYLIHAELARTPEQQETGLMFRRELGANEGMLFVNEESAVRCFWMHNTLIPLTIAFVADDGTIVNLVDMAPRTDDTHCSAKPVRYALEMPQGWFTKRGLDAGLKLRGKPFAN